jgi:putative FmdB family regulatory protein
MPIYEFHCTAHGLFEELRPMQRSAEAATCPRCDGPSPRVLSTTHTTQLPRAVALAHARNEKSQHSPDVRSPTPKQRSAHGTGPRLRAHHGPRPWVIEHG